MGLLLKGKWVDEWYDTKSHKGEFKREKAKIHHQITEDGSPGPDGKGFKAESGRYHLYVSLACPWAHRTLIFRTLKALEDHISVSVVSPDMLEHGWTFQIHEGSTGDAINHYDYLHELYTAHDPEYTGRVTVPVLWDKKTKQIVNNESADIIRILNQAFNSITGNQDDYYPHELKDSIDKINDFVYEHINNGVYRCGFATTQIAYEKAYQTLFDALEFIETILAHHRYLVGERITEADWRLFTTLIRFDAVYHGHFKCNKQRLEDYPNISHYVRELYQWPGVAKTVNFSHIKRHYYYSHTMINPNQIIPVGPDINYFSPHNRKRL
ncbi:glutathione S-transferase family protein [Legionella oakridgensis]|uniref:S-transferase n=2 Tax=Legionella oakridgensis TaxID=29423 RepID=A0A0W0XH07_9GAMM|nr:glutathione S-transferase family protein [Legionella oakridgensis]AHE65908.1 putative glutathione S-transferase [Legionella oakridgensis ATCC 33761 = DSM 21215]ETO94285.1 putative glutathione S-transferase [Legionella oakridgensis RV-2-2007]KTD43762.1 S-transferase [Legionella oakridgensis]STY15839.1 S-transferase [Legionella longbeachae]